MPSPNESNACPECGGGPVTWKCTCEPMWCPSAVVLDDEQSRAIDAVCNTLTPKQTVGLGGHIRALRSIQWQARAASPQATATQPVQTERALTDEQRHAIDTALSLIGLSGDPRVRNVHKTLRALLTAAQPANGDTK